MSFNTKGGCTITMKVDSKADIASFPNSLLCYYYFNGPERIQYSRVQKALLLD